MSSPSEQPWYRPMLRILRNNLLEPCWREKTKREKEWNVRCLLSLLLEAKSCIASCISILQAHTLSLVHTTQSRSARRIIGNMYFIRLDRELCSFYRHHHSIYDIVCYCYYRYSNWKRNCILRLPQFSAPASRNQYIMK